jgi:hypothetical protein
MRSAGVRTEFECMPFFYWNDEGLFFALTQPAWMVPYLFEIPVQKQGKPDIRPLKK